MIYIIRGQKVMLDFELAKIYGYETKAFNQKVKRNITKYPDDLMFILSKDEVKELERSQIVTSELWADGKGGRAYTPHAFTEQGIYMLMTVLKGDFDTVVQLINIIFMKELEIIWILKK